MRDHTLHRPNPRRANLRRLGLRAFTLLELAGALLLVVLLTVWALPSLQGLTASSSLRWAGAVALSAVDQARAAALRGDGTAYLLIWGRPLPETDALMVVNAVEPSGPAQAGEPATVSAATGWIALPRGIVAVGPGDPATTSAESAGLSFEGIAGMPQPGAVSAIGFGRGGGLIFPREPRHIELLLREGVRDAEGHETSRGASGGRALRLKVARSSGRGRIVEAR